MQEEVSAAAETSDAFSDETLKEYAVFQHEKQAEMKELLGGVADGQIEMYKKVRLHRLNLGVVAIVRVILTHVCLLCLTFPGNG